jgi:hypothetical protein
MQTLQQYTIPR